MNKQSGYVIRNEEGKFWCSKPRLFLKSLLTATMYKTEKSAKYHYNLSYEYGNTKIKYEDIELLPVTVELNEGGN